jgi:hypothetical protein
MKQNPLMEKQRAITDRQTKIGHTKKPTLSLIKTITKNNIKNQLGAYYRCPQNIYQTSL